MNPIDFPQKNLVLVGPPETTRPLIIPLPAFKGYDPDGIPVFISCWEPTAEERKGIAEGKPIWFYSLSRFHPPIHLTINDPFAPVLKETTNESSSEVEGTDDGSGGRPPEGVGSGD